ncbi:MAG: RNA methyltransferase [SAR324 cluster bacterium]|nr:RNA methyltransferase [SAR324 cluster bacterium]
MPVPRGLEPVLLAEMNALGLPEIAAEEGGAFFTGTLEDCYRANLWLRSGARVLRVLRRFPCRDDRALYREVREVDWFSHMSADQTLAVRVRLGRTPFTHSQFLSRRIKDAVVDQFRETFGRRPSVDREQPHLQIQAWFEGTECTLCLDTSGAPLFKRGYRSGTADAPLKENLAAALIGLTGWRGERPFFDPMTGAGTLAIEAALIAANRAPGLTRSRFGFQNWPDYQKSTWNRLCAEARKAIRPIEVEIQAADRDPRMIAMARQNAEAAGVGGAIEFVERDFRQTPPRSGVGVLMVNPPYGERSGREENLPELYKALGDVMKQRFTGWDAHVFTAQGELIKSIGLRPARRHILFNGALECRLLHYRIY